MGRRCASCTPRRKVAGQGAKPGLHAWRPARFPALTMATRLPGSASQARPSIDPREEEDRKLSLGVPVRTLTDKRVHDALSRLACQIVPKGQDDEGPCRRSEVLGELECFQVADQVSSRSVGRELEARHFLQLRQDRSDWVPVARGRQTPRQPPVLGKEDPNVALYGLSQRGILERLPL